MATVTKDFRIKSGLVVEGTNGTINASDIITEDAITGGTQTNISVTYNPTTKLVSFVAENGVADSNTDALAEGSTNKYFTDERAQDAVGNAVGTGLTYTDSTGAISVTANTYDAYGSASTVAGNLTTHTSATEAHGATGAVVGTTNTQTLTNKTLTSPKINEDVVLTATATELNILDGATLTTTELNYVDGVTSSIQTQLGAKLPLAGGTMTGAIAMGTSKITGLGAPTESTDAATKAYVDAAVEGLHVHEAARVAVNGNIAIATALENGDTAGGVTLVTGDRVLLKDQTNTAENGIYVVQASGQALRATDFDTATEIDSGDFVFVSAGTYANTGWVQTLKPATIGTDPLQFTQFSGAGTFTAGTGLDLNGTEFVLDLSEVSTTTLPEGTNEYFTVERAQDAVGNAVGTGLSYNDTTGAISPDLTYLVDKTTAQTLTNKTLTSPKINEDVVLTATATELNYVDGVTSAIQTQLNAKATPADITTAVDAITTAVIEENTNLYFTNARAVTALEAVVPDFTAVEVNNIARQVAATVSAPTAATAVTAFAFAKASYRSAKFLVKVAYSTHTEISEVLLTLDTSDNIAITEYAVVGTNGSSSAISADIDGTNVRLRVTPVNASSTVTVMGTLLV